MIMDFLVSLFVFLVVDPAVAEVRGALQAASVPTATIAEITDCLRASGPDLAMRAFEDPVWGVTTAISVAVGMTDAGAAIGEVAPGCAAAIDRALPLVGGFDA